MRRSPPQASVQKHTAVLVRNAPMKPTMCGCRPIRCSTLNCRRIASGRNLVGSTTLTTHGRFERRWIPSKSSPKEPLHPGAKWQWRGDQVWRTRHKNRRSFPCPLTFESRPRSSRPTAAFPTQPRRPTMDRSCVRTPSAGCSHSRRKRQSTKQSMSRSPSELDGRSQQVRSRCCGPTSHDKRARR